jgi:hypothetical protein
MELYNKVKEKNIFWAIVSVVLTLLLLMPLFRKYYLSPNSFMYAFGGDSLTLYYNVVYHTCFGSGTMLKNMNYPDGEMIFLTDAQGSLSLLLSWINRHLFDVCDYVLGIIHSLQMLSIISGTILMYYLYTGLNVEKWRSAIYAALTISMAPQIARVIPHHGLSYGFILPMTLLWLMRKIQVLRWEKRDLLVLFLLLFFGFNNPYLAAISSLTIITTILSKCFIDRSLNKYLVSVFIFGLLPIVSVGTFLKIADPYSDRLAYQWGFYTYASKLEGLFFTPRSLFDKVINMLGWPSFNVQYEASINLGFPITLVLFAFLIVYLFRRKLLTDFNIPAYVKYIFLGGVLIFLYSSNVLFALIPKETVETKLGSLLMFKAVGRLGWTMWFALVILAVVLIEELLRKLAFSGYLYTIVLFLLLWVIDFKVYYKEMFNGHENDNYFKKENKEVTRNDLKRYNINPADYQAILSLPRLIGWTDAFLSENNFMNQFLPWRISAVTGLPIVNGMYSRVSTGHVQERMEFYSHPLIEKQLQKKFPNKKPILLIHGKPNIVPSKGELYLMSIATKLYEENDFAFYALDIDKINQYPLLQSIKQGANPAEVPCMTCITSGFDDAKSTIYYAGGGSKKIEGGEPIYFETVLPNALEDSIYEYSVWTHVDYKSFGSYQHLVKVLDLGGKEVKSHEIFGQNAADVHGQWSRSTVRLTVQPGQKISASLRSRLGFVIDEVLLRPVARNHVKKNANEVVYNGFKVVLN